jgi:glycosyltransferase involved in cell wall biosynthesis
MNEDVTLFYGGLISDGWSHRLNGSEIRPLPEGLPKGPRQIVEIVNLLRELSRFDKIIIHHHVDPILAQYIAKVLGKRTIWYSGSLFELAWEKSITGLDYRSISPTVRRTSEEYYGRILSSLMLSDLLFDHTVRLARMFDINTARRYGKILANSRFLSRLLVRTYKLREPPSVVYPGPDPILEQLSLTSASSEQDYMLAVGPLIPLKNVEGMIRAAAKMRSAKLVVAGEGQERGRLKSVAERLGVVLELRGDCLSEEQLAELYSGCKFLVHLSLYEPFGLTPVEAGMFGKPSIVTNRGGPPEVVVDRETGFVVGPTDYEKICSRMYELLHDDGLRREMGEKARKRVASRFTLERSAKNLLAEVNS